VVVALLGAGGVGAHAALSNSDNGGQQIPRLITPTGPLPSSSPSPLASSPAPSPTPSSAPTPVAHHQQFALRLAITGSVSWIEVRRPGGHVLVSGLVRHGHKLTYRHGPLSVVIGNAAAVQVTRAGTTRKAGRPGEVVKLNVS
jgi:hypothetical protein